MPASGGILIRVHQPWVFLLVIRDRFCSPARVTGHMSPRRTRLGCPMDESAHGTQREMGQQPDVSEPDSRPTGGMELSQLPIVAGSVATTIFVGSYLPMLTRAVRTRDLSSYSRFSLVLANVGNLVQTAYIATLPVGPIWGLHAFYLLATLMMLVLHLRHASKGGTHRECQPVARARIIRSGRW